MLLNYLNARKNSGCGTFGPGVQEGQASVGSWGAEGGEEGESILPYSHLPRQEGHEMWKKQTYRLGLKPMQTNDAIHPMRK